MFKRISARKISDEIIEQFKALLVSGKLKPGDELPPEREMAEMIGVSRPPLREALNALQAMGYVEIRPRSRIVVRSLAERAMQEPLGALIAEDVERLFELLEIRRAMEGWAAARAAQRATAEDLHRLAEILQEDDANLFTGREDARTDADFHLAVATATHNTLLSHLMASCYTLLWDTQKISRERIFQKSGNQARIVEQHRAIYTAIRQGDAAGADRAARAHIDFVEQELREIFAGRETKARQNQQAP